MCVCAIVYELCGCESLSDSRHICMLINGIGNWRVEGIVLGNAGAHGIMNGKV